MICSIAVIPALVCFAIGLGIMALMVFLGIIRPDRWKQPVSLHRWLPCRHCGVYHSRSTGCPICREL